MARKDSRIKYNVMSGFVYQIVYLALSFILPRLYLDNFGSEVNGVLATIRQIFMYLLLIEAGAGTATIQALYKPIAQKQYDISNSILSATKKFYARTGVVYTAAVLLFAVIYSFLVPTSINSWTLFVIIILTALPVIFSYFVQTKYRLLMEVDGRNYVITTSETVLQLLSNIGKILVLLLTDSLVLIQVVYCVLSLIQMSYICIYAKRKYKWLDFKVKPNFEAISQKNSVLVHHISGMVFNNTDVILISIMCDFKNASVYAVYNLFFSQIQNFATRLTSGFNFALGQMFQVDRKKFQKIFSMYETLYMMCAFIIFTIMAVFLLPVIQLYTAGIDDAEYTNAALLFLFVIMNILANGKTPIQQVMSYAGKFKETRSHAIIEMVLNLSVSVVSILKWGVCGAILGSVVALLVRAVITSHYVNKKILERNQMKMYKLWIINGLVFASVMAIFFVDNFSGLGLGELILKGIIHSVWIVSLYIAVNFIFQRSAFRTLFEIIKGDEKI